MYTVHPCAMFTSLPGVGGVRSLDLELDRDLILEL